MKLWTLLLYWLKARRWKATDKWTDADAQWLAGVLCTTQGRKLWALLQNEEIEANAHAVMSTRLEYACGKAVGYRGALTHILSLAATLPPETENNQDDTLPEEFRHLRP